MNALEFIEKDNARYPSAASAAAIVLLAGSLPVLLGLGLREDLGGGFEPRLFLPNLAGALLIGLAVGWGVARRGVNTLQLWLSGGALVCALLLAVERALFPLGARTSYVSSARFWSEGGHCFVKGSITTLIIGASLCAFAFLMSPLPTRRRRFVISVVAGIGGALMLGFHCDSSSIGHVAFGHLSCGLVFGGALFVFQELVVAGRVARKFPRLRNPVRVSR